MHRERNGERLVRKAEMSRYFMHGKVGLQGKEWKEISKKRLRLADISCMER